SPPTWTNAAATAGNRSPAGRWNASCPGTPALKTSAPGHSRHPPDKTRANNDSTGMPAASRHAGPRHALSQDFRILTISPPYRLLSSFGRISHDRRAARWGASRSRTRLQRSGLDLDLGAGFEHGWHERTNQARDTRRGF